MERDPGCRQPQPETDDDFPYDVLEEDLCCAVVTDVPVLISAAPEVAEGIAHRIHRYGPFRDLRFTVIDCDGAEREVGGVLSEALVGGEGRGGYPGTVLLKNVGGLSPALQDRLCGHLPGGSVRILSSSRESLLDMVKLGLFDDNLFYRLNLIHIVVEDEPALR